MIDHLTDTNVGNIEYIRRQDAKDYIDTQNGRPFIGCTVGEAMKIILDEVKSADVAPVERSRWIKTADGAECENCGREAVYQIVDDHWEYENFCPHCGAIMDNKRGNENDQ